MTGGDHGDTPDVPGRRSADEILRDLGLDPTGVAPDDRATAAARIRLSAEQAWDELRGEFTSASGWWSWCGQAEDHLQDAWEHLDRVLERFRETGEFPVRRNLKRWLHDQARNSHKKCRGGRESPWPLPGEDDPFAETVDEHERPRRPAVPLAFSNCELPVVELRSPELAVAPARVRRTSDEVLRRLPPALADGLTRWAEVGGTDGVRQLVVACLQRADPARFSGSNQAEQNRTRFLRHALHATAVCGDDCWGAAGDAVATAARTELLEVLAHAAASMPAVDLHRDRSRALTRWAVRHLRDHGSPPPGNRAARHHRRVTDGVRRWLTTGNGRDVHARACREAAAAPRAPKRRLWIRAWVVLERYRRRLTGSGP